jgi:hypothetical protein
VSCKLRQRKLPTVPNRAVLFAHTTAPGAQTTARPGALSCVSPRPSPASHPLFSSLSFSPGTYASYVLDGDGLPLLRLRSDAVHTANLARSPRCSLFVQAPDRPARLLARCTLVGSAAPLPPGEEADAAASAHAALHGSSGAGVDAPRADDVYFRLDVESVFHVAGLGGCAAAESISAEEYRGATPDGLRAGAAALVREFNAHRPAEVARIAALAAGCALDDLAAAELLWVDEAGAYAWLAREGGAESGDEGGGSGAGGEVVRVRFARRVLDDRDARSCLTMLSQLAWELERGYVPVMPAVPDLPVA